jgi:hypothetical protein
MNATTWIVVTVGAGVLLMAWVVLAVRSARLETQAALARRQAQEEAEQRAKEEAERRHKENVARAVRSIEYLISDTQ